MHAANFREGLFEYQFKALINATTSKVTVYLLFDHYLCCIT